MCSGNCDCVNMQILAFVAGQLVASLLVLASTLFMRAE